MHRHAHRRHQLVDAGHALLGIDEQPFPIEGDDLHLERLGARRERPVGIEQVAADPDHPAQQHDDQGRDRPDDRLDPARERPLRQVLRLGVGRAVTPGHPEGEQDGRDDDRQHDEPSSRSMIVQACSDRPALRDGSRPPPRPWRNRRAGSGPRARTRSGPRPAAIRSRGARARRSAPVQVASSLPPSRVEAEKATHRARRPAALLAFAKNSQNIVLPARTGGFARGRGRGGPDRSIRGTAAAWPNLRPGAHG